MNTVADVAVVRGACLSVAFLLLVSGVLVLLWSVLMAPLLLLPTPWSMAAIGCVFPPPPPRYVPSFLSRIEFSIPTALSAIYALLDFHRICQLTLSRFPLLNF